MIPPKGWRLREAGARARYSAKFADPAVEAALAQFHIDREAKLAELAAAEKSAPVGIVTVATMLETPAPAPEDVTPDEDEAPEPEAAEEAPEPEAAPETPAPEAPAPEAPTPEAPAAKPAAKKAAKAPAKKS